MNEGPPAAEHPAERFVRLAGEGLTRLRGGSVLLEPSPSGASVTLAWIAAVRPGGGWGTAALGLICRLADAGGLEIHLLAAARDVDRLVRFYGRFGFEAHARIPTWTGGGMAPMTRRPQAAMAADPGPGWLGGGRESSDTSGILDAFGEAA